MRKNRMKRAGDAGPVYYHCVTRIVGGQFLLGDEEKDQIVELLWRWEAFCGVQVLTYCVMSNHFHVLVEVPTRPEDLPDDDALMARMRATGGVVATDFLRARFESVSAEKTAAGRAAAREVVREEVLRRMWDVSSFMKLVKQQFTHWFNTKHQRRGTLWEQRFKSVLVEGPALTPPADAGAVPGAAGSTALAVMACYIDLNPVRAGVVRHPGNYRWCGYASAVAGDRRARRGLGVVAQAMLTSPGHAPWPMVQAAYDGWLKQRGGKQPTAKVVEVKRGRKPKRDRPVLADALRRRLRYFTDGGAVGSRDFVESVFVANREKFGEVRKTGARPLRQIHAPGLHVLRDLQVNVVGEAPGKQK